MAKDALKFDKHIADCSACVDAASGAEPLSMLHCSASLY